jgi:hypothetical protein
MPPKEKLKNSLSPLLLVLLSLGLPAPVGAENSGGVSVIGAKSTHHVLTAPAARIAFLHGLPADCEQQLQESETLYQALTYAARGYVMTAVEFRHFENPNPGGLNGYELVFHYQGNEGDHSIEPLTMSCEL